MEDKISIIVPIYKVEQYLPRCIDSLTSQTYKNIELILIDDGSPDRCGKICDEYAEKDKRVKVVHKPNGGLSDARNKGLDIASGDYIMFVDSDDWIEKESCEVIVGLFDKYNVDIVSFGIQLINDKRVIKTQKTHASGILTPKEGVKAMIYQQPKVGLLNYVCNKAFKRHLFETIRFPVGMLFEDQDVTYKLMHKSHKIYAIDKVFYNYYQRDESIMKGFYRKKSMHDRILIWMRRLEFLEQNYPQFSKYQVAQILGDIYIALILHKEGCTCDDFYLYLKQFAAQWKNDEREFAKYNRKVKLHYYCYPLFWLYVKSLSK